MQLSRARAGWLIVPANVCGAGRIRYGQAVASSRPGDPKLKAFLAITAGAALAFCAGRAHAAGSLVSGTGKGITGCALLGGEAVMLVEGALGVKPWWAYAIGGGLGAIGGGIGGYYTEQGDPKLPFYLFMGGMALALPTAVVVLDATKFHPVNYTEDQPPADEPVAEPAAPVPPPASAPADKPLGDARDQHRGKAPTQRAKATRLAARRRSVAAPGLPMPPALLDVTAGALRIAVPAVEVRHVYTRTEIAMLGVKQGTEVEVPVLNVQF